MQFSRLAMVSAFLDEARHQYFLAVDRVDIHSLAALQPEQRPQLIQALVEVAVAFHLERALVPVAGLVVVASNLLVPR